MASMLEQGGLPLRGKEGPGAAATARRPGAPGRAAVLFGGGFVSSRSIATSTFHLAAQRVRRYASSASGNMDLSMSMAARSGRRRFVV